MNHVYLALIPPVLVAPIKLLPILMLFVLFVLGVFGLYFLIQASIRKEKHFKFKLWVALSLFVVGLISTFFIPF